jgi:ADP-heptose:LPS heptosyltransferase
MSPNTVAPWQKVVVFTDKNVAPSTVEQELQQLCPSAELTTVGPTQVAQLLSPPSDGSVDWHRAITWLRQQQFDAAVIFNQPTQSPYTLAYLCYLANIPIRIGHSQEFGGLVLTHDWQTLKEEMGRQVLGSRGRVPGPGSRGQIFPAL